MSQVCFVFDTEEAANAACAKCNTELNNTWGSVVLRNSDSKYYFEKPDELDFNCQNCAEATKCTYTEETNDGSWDAGTN